MCKTKAAVAKAQFLRCADVGCVLVASGTSIDAGCASMGKDDAPAAPSDPRFSWVEERVVATLKVKADKFKRMLNTGDEKAALWKFFEQDDACAYFVDGMKDMFCYTTAPASQKKKMMWMLKAELQISEEHRGVGDGGRPSPKLLEKDQTLAGVFLLLISNPKNTGLARDDRRRARRGAPQDGRRDGVALGQTEEDAAAAAARRHARVPAAALEGERLDARARDLGRHVADQIGGDQDRLRRPSTRAPVPARASTSAELSRDGAYIDGLSVEGARWDVQAGLLDEAMAGEFLPAAPRRPRQGDDDRQGRRATCTSACATRRWTAGRRTFTAGLDEAAARQGDGGRRAADERQEEPVGRLVRCCFDTISRPHELRGWRACRGRTWGDASLALRYKTTACVQGSCRGLRR